VAATTGERRCKLEVTRIRVDALSTSEFGGWLSREGCADEPDSRIRELLLVNFIKDCCIMKRWA
jgi:hypothetical protein